MVGTFDSTCPWRGMATRGSEHAHGTDGERHADDPQTLPEAASKGSVTNRQEMPRQSFRRLLTSFTRMRETLPRPTRGGRWARVRISGIAFFSRKRKPASYRSLSVNRRGVGANGTGHPGRATLISVQGQEPVASRCLSDSESTPCRVSVKCLSAGNSAPAAKPNTHWRGRSEAKSSQHRHLS